MLGTKFANGMSCTANLRQLAGTVSYGPSIWILCIHYAINIKGDSMHGIKLKDTFKSSSRYIKHLNET